jgi:hypothetical protein
MRRFAIALMAVVIGGCGSAAGTAGFSPSAGVQASPPPSLLPLHSPSPSPAPSPVATLPCRMPAILRVDQGGNREVLGYVSLPSGVTTDDPSDAIVKVADFPVAGATTPIWGTMASPQLLGVPFATYSPAAGRWLPAPPALVSPDGLGYAYLHADGTIRLATSDGSQITVSNPSSLTPLAYTSSGVVLVQNLAAANGLWLLDPATQSLTPITPPAGTDDWLYVSSITPTSTSSGGTFVYGLDSPGGLGAPPSTAVIAAQLVAGTPVKTIYTSAPGTITFIAADQDGGLLAVVAGSVSSLVYISPLTRPAPVAAPAGIDPEQIGRRNHADAHGIWFLGGTGIFLFNATSGLQKIAPGTTSDIVPAGDCA